LPPAGEGAGRRTWLGFAIAEPSTKRGANAIAPCFNERAISRGSKISERFFIPCRFECGNRTGFSKLAYQAGQMEVEMGFGKGALLWLIGIPLPIILLLAIFMHH